MTPEPRSAIVVGGGIAGLLAADALIGAGVEVTLVEATDRLGGLVASDERDGLLLEHGPDALVTAKPAGARLIDRLGLADRAVPSAPGGASIVWRGRLLPIPPETVLGIPTSLRAIARSPLFGRRHAARMALDLVLPGGEREGDISVGELVGRRLGRAAVERLVGPLLGGISSAAIDRISVAAAFPQLLDAEHYRGSLIRSARAAARGRSGVPPFVTLRGGMGELVGALAERLARGTLATGDPARSIRPGARGLLVTTTRRTLEAPLVVVATPPPAAADLLSALSPGAAAGLRAIACQSTAVVHLAYSADPRLQGRLGHGFLVPPSERRSISGVTDVSAKWPHRAPPDTLLLRAYVDHRLAGRDGPPDGRLADSAVADLRAIAGLRAEPWLVLVHRLPESMPQATVGHLERVAAIRRELAGAGTVLLVGGAYDGVGIPNIAEGVDQQLQRVVAA